MINKLKKWFENLQLEKQISVSFWSIQIPLMLLLIVTIVILQDTNSRYEDMIQSAVVAGEFSLDFKKDFDDETYLLIAGNKNPDESNMNSLLEQARGVEDQLMGLTQSEDNKKRIKAAYKYLDNLAVYKDRIERNLQRGDKYEENMQIWENDVQIVSALLQETMSEYIYYEIRDMQNAKQRYSRIYTRLVGGILTAMVIISALSVYLSIYLPGTISKPIEKHVTEEQTRLRKAELELLQSQINPHFLYNTLDTIVWAAEDSDQKTVVSMVKSLSEFFRTSLNSGKEIVTIEEEIMHARSYLEIQQIRYRDIMEYDISIPGEIYSCLIPKITIQPLIENALYHGIKNKRGMGKITVSGEKKDNLAYIYVTDNGKGMTEERLRVVNEKIADNTSAEGDVFGLSNINERIQLKFGNEYGIHISSVLDEGTTVSVVLPVDSQEAV